MAGEEILRLKAEARAESGGGSLMALGEAIHDDLTQANVLDIREAYATIPWGAFDFRAGKQIITWGNGDFLFVNDFFPKNYAAFYAGLPMDHLKEGLTVMRLSGYSAFANMEIIATPFFQENIYPGPDRFILPDNPGGGPSPELVRPSLRFENSEAAARVYRNILGWDAAIYGYTGTARQPTLQITPTDTAPIMRLSYPRIGSVGASLLGSLPGAIINLEAGYSRPYGNGGWDAPFLTEQETKLLAGIKAGQTGSWSLGLQYYVELLSFSEKTAPMRNGNPLAPKETHQIVTASVDVSPGYQTFRLYVFGYYDITYEEEFILPEASYQISDKISIAMGARVYLGAGDPRSFGNYEGNDCVFTRFTYNI